MSLAAGVLGLGRKQAEALMDSTCTIRTKATSTLDEATGLYTDTSTTIYSGKCRIRYRSESVSSNDSAGQQLAIQTPELWIPVNASGSGDVRTDNVVTIDTNPFDTSVVGTVFRIAGSHSQTHSTARRFPVEVSS